MPLELSFALLQGVVKSKAAHPVQMPIVTARSAVFKVAPFF
jgi:hypothetical protein